ncbi:MAG: methyltransferase domain-containing protein [archaeon]
MRTKGPYKARHLFFDSIFTPVFENYKRKLAEHIVKFCDDDSKILDVGCDDGSVAKMMMDINPSLKIIGIDIQANRKSKIPRKIYDGKKIPYPKNSFDIVMALDVLHHTKDIFAVLNEMRQVSKRCVLIKDNFSHSPISKFLLGVGDWIGNVPLGIPCSFNYPTPKEWKTHFKKAGLKIMKQDLSFDVFISGKYQPTFKLEKK